MSWSSLLLVVESHALNSFTTVSKQTWDQCKKKIKKLKKRLQALKAQSEDPLPELHEALHEEKELIKVLTSVRASGQDNHTAALWALQMLACLSAFCDQEKCSGQLKDFPCPPSNSVLVS